MSKPIKPKAYSYLRFSTPEQTKGDSFKRQTRMALEYATRHNLELDEALTFQDLGVSAYRGLNAEVGRLADFLEAVKEGLVPQGSFLLVEALDRLSRLTPRKAMRVLEDIVESGVTVVTLNDGRMYTVENLDEDPTSLLVAIVLFMRANEESVTKSRRLKSAWDGKREKLDTVPLTAITPAWINLDRESMVLGLIPERAEVVRQIFAMYEAGSGAALIASSLNKAGVPCFGDAVLWHRTYIRKIVTNPAAMGTITPNKIMYLDGKRTRVPLEPVPGYFPAVISKELFESVQRASESPARHREGKVASLFAGLAKCPKCGHTMTRVNKGASGKGGSPKLVCTKAKAGAGCTYKSVPLGDTEQALIDEVGHLMAMAPSGNGGVDDALDAVENEIGAARDAIDNLVSVLSVTPSSAIASKLSELEIELGKMEASRDELAGRAVDASGPILRKRMAELGEALGDTPRDNAKANAAMRSLFQSVTIDYVSGTLDFHWKHGGETSVRYAMGEG